MVPVGSGAGGVRGVCCFAVSVPTGMRARLVWYEAVCVLGRGWDCAGGKALGQSERLASGKVFLGGGSVSACVWGLFSRPFLRSVISALSFHCGTCSGDSLGGVDGGCANAAVVNILSSRQPPRSPRKCTRRVASELTDESTHTHRQLVLRLGDLSSQQQIPR